MLKAQVIETNGVSSLVFSNTANGKSATLPGVTVKSLVEAQAAFKLYLDAVKRSKMLQRTLEGEFTTGKSKDSVEAREENVKANRERMTLHLSMIYQPDELPVVYGALERIQLECQNLLGDDDFYRVLNARRNVPKLAEEFLTEFVTSSSTVVELTSEEPTTQPEQEEITEIAV